MGRLVAGVVSQSRSGAAVVLAELAERQVAQHEVLSIPRAPRAYACQRTRFSIQITFDAAYAFVFSHEAGICHRTRILFVPRKAQIRAS